MSTAYTFYVELVNMIYVDILCVNPGMSSMHDRLMTARDAAGYRSAAKAAEALGMSKSTYGAHENGQNEFDPEQARIYAKKFHTTAGWLLTGDSDPPQKSPRTSAKNAEIRDDNVEILEPETRAGAGSGGIDFEPMVTSTNGVTIHEDAVRDRWFMPSSFVTGQLRIRNGGAAIIEVYGDSMYDPDNPGAPGSLFPGDRVIVDTSDRAPTPPGAFLVWDGIGVVVKLVEHIRGSEPARIRLKSRNPTYETYEAIEGEAVIIGRVRGRISSM